MKHSILTWSSLWALTTAALAPVIAADEAATPSSRTRVFENEQARIDMIDRVSQATVCVFDETRDGGGAGVLIDPEGYGLTNFHVIQSIIGTRRGYGGLSDGKLYPLELLGIDPGGDVAMFKLQGRNDFPVAEMGDSDRLRLADTTIAMGNPFGLANDFTPTVTVGIVTGLHRYQYGSGNKLVYSDCIQTDSSINPGNSGGPLFDAAGQILGINGRASFARRERINVGLAYAITINQIKRFIPGLRAGLLINHGSLGATVRDLPDGDVVVDALLEDSPAKLADLRLNDKLISFGGVDIRTANHFLSVLGTYPQQWPVEIVIERAGQRIAQTTRLEPTHIQLPGPYNVDPGTNRRAAERIWAKWQSTLTKTDDVQVMDFKGRRHVAGEDNGGPVTVQSRRGEGYTMVRRDGDTGPKIIEKCAETASSKTIDDQDALISPRRIRELLAQRALHWRGLWPAKGPLPEDARHVGGDEVDGVILDVLEINFSENQRIHLGTDSATGRLHRFTVWFDDQNTNVVIDLSDHRDFNGRQLPHRWRISSPRREPIRIDIDQYGNVSP
jgi:S1-C subfamily serine protease